MTVPDISIVVCTRNRAGLLQGALASLYDLATEDEFSYEIVVIDSGSTDETPRIIAEAAAQSRHPLRGLVEREPGLVAARNRGIREARGRWITFFGDDQLADWHWLAELYRGAVERNCRVVGGGVQLALPAGISRELAPEVRELLGEPLGDDLPQAYGPGLKPGCGTLLVQRSVFDEIGSYENAIDGRGEDGDFFDRIQRGRIEAWYVPTATVHQLTPAPRLEADALLGLARRVGIGAALRERASLGLVRFTLAWLRRWIGLWLIDYPCYLGATLRRDPEDRLGRRCQVAMSRGYLVGACQSAPAPLPPETAADFGLAAGTAPAAPALEVAPAAAQAVVLQPAAKPAAAPAAEPSAAPPIPAPTPAPAFSLRSAEPTAVMDFPPFSVGRPGSGSR